MVLNGKCPCCGRKVAVPLMTVATVVVKRTCRGCKSVWNVKAVPLPVKKPGVFAVHALEFVKLGGAL